MNMIQHIRFRAGALAPAVAALLSISCGGSKETGPSVGAVASIVLTPDPVTLTALGATQQIGATAKDASGNVVSGATITFLGTGHGDATVSTTGLVTAVAVGADTVTATSGTVTATAPVVVRQDVATIAVTPGSASFATQGRTVQLAAAAADANAHPIPGTVFTWQSSDTTVARVTATGLATAVNDGVAQAQAMAGGKTGSATITVSRVVVGVTVRPANGQKADTLTALDSTLAFNGTATDSSGAVIAGKAFTWLSRATGTATVSPSSGAVTQAKAVWNGTAVIVGTAGTLSDSATLLVNGSLPLSRGVDIGDIFFKSARNGTSNPAVDTIAAGGTVTWTWGGYYSHGVQSTGSPSFTNSVTQINGTYSYTFGAAGTYTYDCAVHGTAMTGTIVVR